METEKRNQPNGKNRKASSHVHTARQVWCDCQGPQMWKERHESDIGGYSFTETKCRLNFVHTLQNLV